MIPAFNEGQLLPRTLDSIRSRMPPGVSYEVIVVDHGSTDETVAVAKRGGATVHAHPYGTVAALRNFGRRQANGEVLVFLDADVCLTQPWRNQIEDTIATLRAEPRLLTGSWCGTSDTPTWIERHWFKPLVRSHNSHINSGHLITTPAAFDEIGGFAEALETGEDYDLSMRAKAAGMRVREDARLLVVHDGYPRTVREFLRRERWHGKGDLTTLRGALESKVVLASLVFWIVQLGAVLSLAVLEWRVAALCVAVLALLCFTASYTKYRGAALATIAINAFLYCVYFNARGLSLIDAVHRPLGGRRQRDS